MNPHAVDRCATLVDLLQLRAQDKDGALLYRFLRTGDADGATDEWSYAHLDRRARSLGALLEGMGATGKRALLLYAPGLEFVAGFMGCLYGGVTAVPCYPPDPVRMDRTLPRLRAIAMDCEAGLVLTTSAIAGMADALASRAPELAALQWIATDAADVADLAEAFRPPRIHADTLAFLQYTSGSTGDPRGVMLSHGNVLANQRLIARRFGHDENTVGVSWLPMFHDMGLIGKIIQPLYLGIPCTIMSPLAFLERPVRWLAAISRFAATTSGGPNFAYDLCARKVTEEDKRSLDLSSWSVAFNGAEPIRKDTIDRFSAAFAPCGFRREAFYACYGLAEATLIVSGGRKGQGPVMHPVASEPLRRGRVVDAGDSDAATTRWLVSSGQYAPDMDIAVVDSETRTGCEPGRIGEIWVRGPSVGQGYWNRPEDTARIFAAHRADTGDGPFLRTGDLGFVWDGELTITGRHKDVVILGGQNHYPQDIEVTVERAHPAVRPGCCAAFAVEPEAAPEVLVVVAEVDPRKAPEGTGAVIRAIRARVAEDHGIYAHAVALLAPRTIPKTSSGKIQRRTCRSAYLANTLDAVDISVVGAEVDMAAGGEPQTAVQAALAAMVADVLGREAVGIHDDFFALGGHSLAAMQVAARVRDAFAVELPVRELFLRPTVATLAELLEGSSVPYHVPASEPIEPLADRAALPLSYAQERFWVYSQLDPSGFFSNVMTALRLDGRLHVPALEQSIQDLVARHEILRTTIQVRDDRPHQVIREQMLFTVMPVDLTGVAADERDTAMRAEAAAEERRPFNLEHGPLIRWRLLRMAEDRHVLLVTMHHLITDAWSVALLLRELAALYRARVENTPAALAPVALHYADYAVWHRRWLDSGVVDRELVYWKDVLHGAPLALDLPLDRPRTTRAWTAGSQLLFEIPAPLVDALQVLGRQHGVTLFMTLLAAFKVLLSRYTGETDIVVATPIAGRLRAETETMLGLFLNLVVLRTDLSGSVAGHSGFAGLLQRVKEVTLGAYTHQHVPFERLVRELVPEEGRGRAPFTRVVFNLHNIPAAEMALPGLHATPLYLDSEIAKFDLSLELAQRAGGLVGRMHYSAEHFDRATVERIARHYENLLEAVVRAPATNIHELALMTPAEEAEVVVACNDTAVVHETAAPAHEMVLARAARCPDAPAIWSESESLTYGQLRQRALACARVLINLGVRPEQPVAVCLHRTPAQIPWVLGVMAAGAAYLPLLPEDPPARLGAMLADAGVALVVTEESLRHLFVDFTGQVIDGHASGANVDPAGMDAILAGRVLSPEQTAYIIYTSGSTGRPKGVYVPHRALTNHLCFRQRAFPLGPGDRFVHKAASAFDIALWELYAPLIAGATVLLCRPGGQRNSTYVAKIVVEQKATHIHFIPFMLEAFLEVPAARACRSLRRVFSGGEPLSSALKERFGHILPEVELIQQYGPTEATIDVTTFVTGSGRDEAIVPIGRPIDNTRIYVLDERLRPVPAGVPGELYIGGAALARGYGNAPGLTASRFVPDPFSAAPGMRLYRTGDRARRLAGGALQFLGRTDHQVKIRGYRVELGEVEAALGAHPDVAGAVALLREDGGTHHLVAYVAPHQGAAVDDPALRAFLQPRLPEPMIPAEVTFLAELPLTTTGKVDRRALQTLEQTSRAASDEIVAPRTPVEEALCTMFAAVLGVERIGVDDDFFARGGDSLAAARLLSRISAHFAMDLDLGVFFETPTVATLATHIEAGEPSRASHVVPLKASGTRPPLFCVHSGGGHVFAYHHLSSHMDPDRPVYGLQSRALDDLSREFKSLDEMAAGYAAAVCEVQPQGPVHLFGWSFGGLLAMSIARDLEARGRQVAFVGMFDVYPRDAIPKGASVDPLRGAVLTFGNAFTEAFEAFPEEEKAELREEIVNLSPKQQLAHLMDWARPRGLVTEDISLDFLDRQQGLTWIHAELAKHSAVPVIDAPIYQWWARDLPAGFDLVNGYPSWAAHTRSEVFSEVVEGDHFTAMRPPWCAGFARSLEARLAEATARAASRSAASRPKAASTR